MPSADDADALGIVVIGRNEGERLRRCLASIGAQSGCIVYVDSGSTDGSAAMAAAMGVLVVNLDMNEPFTAARARNAGAEALRAKMPHVRVIQFVDGDCEIVKGWLAAAMDFLKQRDDVAVVCGRRRERYPDASIYNWLCDIEWNTPVGEAAACGGDSAMRVSAFEAVGGFRAQLIAGEEPELCVRIRENGWKIWRLDDEMTVHDAAITRFSQWWARSVRGGYGFTEVLLLHRRSRFQIWKREVVRAMFWGGLLPVGIAAASFFSFWSLLAVLVYPLQVCRVALRKGGPRMEAFLYALFIVLGKFPEFQGVLKFFWRRWRGDQSQLIEYKRGDRH